MRTTFILVVWIHIYSLGCGYLNWSHLSQLQICTQVCEAHNSRWGQGCWLSLTGSLEQFHWSENDSVTLDRELWKETWISDNFSTIPLPLFVSSTYASYYFDKRPKFNHPWRSIGKLFVTHLISKPDHHGLHRSVALKNGHWGHLTMKSCIAAPYCFIHLVRFRHHSLGYSFWPCPSCLIHRKPHLKWTWFVLANVLPKKTAKIIFQISE